ncbi:MAG: right-handed parallel beta-helix repeat-containing protein [Flavobacterium sp.]
MVDGFVITRNTNSPVNMLGIFEHNSEVTYSNCTFRELSYGAIKIWNQSNTSYTDCKFLDNVALHEDYTTVFMHMGGHASFQNCNFIGNKAFAGSAVYLKNNSFVRMDSCLFSANNNDFMSSTGKVIMIENSSATITNCDFDANGDNYSDGAALSIFGFVDPYVPEWTHPVTVTVDRCSFTNNLNRGVLYSGRSTDKTSISNSLFYKNQGGSGGAIAKALDGSFYLTNCTITQNYASNQVAGGIYIGEGNGNNYIRNSIIYNNSAIYFYTPEVWVYSPVSFRNTIIRTSGGSANWNAGALNYFDMPPMAVDLGGNLDVNPLFADAANGDFHLTGLSPAINLGDNSLYNTGTFPDLSLFTSDLDGTPRIQENRVDMGAYEYMPDLGLNPVEVTNGISVYPNPTKGIVNVYSAFSDVKEIKIYNILGKEIITVQGDKIDLINLSKGVYILKAKLDTGMIFAGKVVRE